MVLKNIREHLICIRLLIEQIFLGSGITFSLSGRLTIDFFTCEKLLLAKTKARIKLIGARPNFSHAV